MTKIFIGDKIIEASKGTRLVLALEDNGVDILHLCGGNAQCGTCRVQIINGDPGPLSPLEGRTLKTKGIDITSNIRLSCQILLNSDLEVKPILTVKETGMNPGPRPNDLIIR